VRRTVMALSIAASVAFCSNTVFATVNDDQVTSQKIREADGASGQNTNSGSGVKTGHIQDGAVTDAKIGGTISASKIQGGVFQKKYANVIVVAKSGGDFTDPSAAMNSITDASAANRYLIKIMPGAYTLGSYVRMKPYVDMEGSGRDVTKLSKASDLVVYFEGSHPGVVFNSELRDMTLEDPAVSTYTLGVVSLFDALGVSLRNLNITISGSTEALGIYAAGSNYSLDNVNINAQSAATSIGMLTNGCTVNLHKTTILASGGAAGFSDWISAGIDIVNSGSVVTIRNSEITSTQHAINSGPIYNGYPTTFKIYNSRLSGMISAATLEPATHLFASATEINGPLTGGATLVNCFDSNFFPIPNQ